MWIERISNDKRTPRGLHQHYELWVIGERTSNLFKKELDKFLLTIADRPLTCGCIARRRTDSNSLLHMVPACKKFVFHKLSQCVSRYPSTMLELFSIACYKYEYKYKFKSKQNNRDTRLRWIEYFTFVGIFRMLFHLCLIITLGRSFHLQGA